MDNEYKAYFLQIVKKYNDGTATSEEKEFLDTHYHVFELKEDLITAENEEEFRPTKMSIKSAVDQQIDQYNKRSSNIRSIWIKYAAAAILLLASALILHVTLRKSPETQDQIARHILPGGNRATLTLANGKKIVLDDAKSGEIAKQSGVSIAKTSQNQIIYTETAAGGAGTDQQAAYNLQNTITTPRGGQYTVKLPDGTKVTLNAASTLIYPAAFHGSERVVQLDGEAYLKLQKIKPCLSG